MEQYEIIIIGAGISGLSLALYCAKQGLRPLVIEKSERVGGTFHSSFFSGEASDFWLELGAHTCYNSYGNLIDLMRDCHLLDTIIKREKVGYKMVINGELKSIPSQMRFAELMLSAPGLFFRNRSGKTIEAYYSGIVGKKNFQNVFGPLFDAVICQRANDFPADLLFKKRPKRKELLKNFTLLHGIQSIADAISVQPGISVLKGKDVREIATANDAYQVTVEDGPTYIARSIAIATDASMAARLLKDLFPRISERLSEIRVGTVESVGVAVKKKAVSVPPIAGLVAVNDAFYSVVSRDTVKHDLYRGFSFHFRHGLLDQEAKLKRIAEVLKVNISQIEGVVAKNNFVPSLHTGHETLVREIDTLLAGKRVLLTGNYFSGLAIEDCVSRSLNESTRLKNILAGS